MRVKDGYYGYMGLFLLLLNDFYHELFILILRCFVGIF